MGLFYLLLYLTTQFGPTFSHRHVLHLRHLDEKYYCVISMPELKWHLIFTSIIQIKKAGFRRFVL